MASFKISHDFDQENKASDLNRVLKESNVQNQGKRTVLGVLNKNVSNKQPLKPLKQESKDEKAMLKTKPAVGRTKFSVQGSSFNENVEKENVTKVTAAVVAVATSMEQCKPKQPEATGKLRQPLSDLPSGNQIPVSDTDQESPMVLDKSMEIGHKETLEINKLSSLLDGYAEDIYMYMRETEARHRPRPGYMSKQPDITYSMRCILVDWLVEVAEEYKLQTETLYLAVSYIDRFLSYMSVVRAKLQLVGTAAMLIAAKYEEIYPPDVGEFVYITDDTYTKKQVLRMEHLILKVLAFDLSVPTVLSFITVYSNVTNDSETVMYLAMFISELALVEGDPFLQYLPSMRAASSIALARHTMELDPWPKALETMSGYVLRDIMPCVEQLTKVYVESKNHPQQAIKEKYKSHRWHNVSMINPPESPMC